jgi:hypothetical protein
MKFIRSRIENNVIIMYYKSDNGETIKKKKYPYNRLIPLTHKRKYKKYPPNSVSTNKIYTDIYNCKFNHEIYFNDLDF